MDNEFFRQLLKHIHQFYKQERALREIGGINFQRIKAAARPLIDFTKENPGLLHNLVYYLQDYPFDLFGVSAKRRRQNVLNDPIIISSTLGKTTFQIHGVNTPEFRILFPAED